MMMMHSSLLVNSFLCSSSAFNSSPPESAVEPVPGVWCVWSDGSSQLSFCPKTDSLTLTVREALGSCPQEAIMVLRDRLGDQDIVRKVRANRTGMAEEDSYVISIEMLQLLNVKEARVIITPCHDYYNL